MKNPTRFRAEEARILAAKAAATPVDQSVAAHDLWHEAGDAFMAAASSSFGDPELYFDATEAYIAAGDLHRARRASDQYAPAVHRGAAAESRYWRSVVSRIRIDRELGDPKGALERVQGIIERHESGVHRYELLMERGLCQEMLGAEDAALRDYDSVYRELDPSSGTWQDALHRWAIILHRRVEDQAVGLAGGVPGGGLLDSSEERLVG